MLKILNMKVVSYCDIPEEIDKGWLDELGCDVYTEYNLLEEEEGELQDWLRTTYPELINTTFLIHIDY